MNKTVAMILAGGRGKRLDILSQARPKPGLPFAGNLRVIDFTLSNCLHSGIDTAGMLLDYQRSYLAEYARAWHAANRRLSRLDLLEPAGECSSGTADAVYQQMEYLRESEAELVLVLAGDHIYKMDYRKIVAFHTEVKADVTVGTVAIPLEQTFRFGTMKVDADYRIRAFVEKSRRNPSNLASMGIYVFNKQVLIRRLIEDAQDGESVHDFGFSVLPGMVGRDRAFSYLYQDYWEDIGSAESYYRANMALIGSEPPYSLDDNWPILNSEGGPPAAKVDSGNIVNSLVSPGCVIEGRVENSILSQGVHIGENVVVRDSILMHNVGIGSNSEVVKTIVDEGVTIGEHCRVGHGERPEDGSEITIVGRNCLISPRTAISCGRRVVPGTALEDFPGYLIPGRKPD